MAEKFEGFANAPVVKGKRVDFRTVKPFVDESDEGKVAEASRRTPSSLSQFKTDDTSTEGAPAARVPAPKDAPAAEGKEGSGS